MAQAQAQATRLANSANVLEWNIQLELNLT
jgi:hypothetical protein